MSKVIGNIGGDEEANHSRWGNYLEKYGKNIKNVALVIAVILSYLALLKTDQTYTSLGAAKTSMQILFWVIVLVGYHVGGTPTGLKTMAIIGVILLLVPIFFQMTPQQILSKAVNIISSSAPRDLGWMSREIKSTPEKIVRVYNGDKFVYKASFGFWVEEEGGSKHYHNPSMQPGEIRSFNFYDLPAEGREIKIRAKEKNTTFWMDFRIVRG